MTRRAWMAVRFRTVVAGVLAGVVLASLAAPAGATIVRSVDFAEQCADAEAIVVATVRGVSSRRMVAAPSFFETLVTLTVDEVVAGTAPAELTVRLAGGQVGAIRQSIDGMPEFAVGERYVVFLDREQDPPLVSPIVGFNQGLYRVERVAGADVVRDRSGHALPETAVAALSARVGATPAPEAPAGGAPSLEQFLAAVRAARPR